MSTERVFSPEYTEEIRSRVRQRLSPRRYEHSCAVADVAVHFARKAGYDESKAELAGLLHDVARELTPEQAEEAVEKYGIRLNRYDRAFPPNVHGKVGAAIAREEFGIEDEEILAAIRVHVSGRPCMKTPEQVLYLADHIARLSTYLPEQAEERMAEPLEQALLQILGHVIDYDAKHKKPVDERTLQTFDWMIEKIRNEPKTGPTDLTEEELGAFYDRMDELLALYARHAVRGFPAENFRDLGGYEARDGRTIRKHKILRSGNPDQFGAEDYERLTSLGINTIVDLRSAEEKKASPDLGCSGIRYIDVPFESVSESRSYLEVLLEWLNECDDPEESAWLTARYFDAFDIDGMYLKLLTGDGSREKFKKILRIMLDDDCTGILYFCRSGKDRTGIVTAVILDALGVGSDTALDDYMVSQVPYYAITMNYLNQLRRRDYNLAVQRQVFAVLGVESERPMRLNREILAEYGEYKRYFDFEGSFGADAAERFRNKFLE